MQNISTILHTSVIQKRPFDWAHNIITSSALVSRSKRRRWTVHFCVPERATCCLFYDALRNIDITPSN